MMNMHTFVFNQVEKKNAGDSRPQAEDECNRDKDRLPRKRRYSSDSDDDKERKEKKRREQEDNARGRNSVDRDAEKFDDRRKRDNRDYYSRINHFNDRSDYRFRREEGIRDRNDDRRYRPRDEEGRRGDLENGEGKRYPDAEG
jgi:hypothetical protein